MATSDEQELQAMQQQAAMQAREEQRDTMLSMLLTKEARARLGTIKMVKPDKARSVEHVILSAAQTGQISAAKPLDERGLISLLEQITARDPKSSSKVVTRRKKGVSSSDDDNDY